MRSMQPKDMPRLIALHDEQNARDGTRYPLPRIFHADGRLSDRIALALTVEKDAPVQGIYFESGIVEMCFAGCDPRATAHSRREIAGVRYALRGMGYHGIRSLIPKPLVEQLEKPMLAAGFARTDHDFASFYLDIEAP